MATFHIKLKGSGAEQAEVLVNGRPLVNVIALSIKQGPTGRPEVSVTIPAEQLVVDGDAELKVIRIDQRPPAA